MATWFSSDHHFMHRNVIDYCDRPWRRADGHPDAEAMNRDLIRYWNELVQPQDMVYYLGDFALGSRKRLPELRRSLNGIFTFVRGNHDPSRQSLLQAGFEEVVNQTTVKVRDLFLFLVHAPLPAHPGDFVIHGHVHEKWKRNGHWVNVGVDVWDYRPVALEQVLALVGL